MRATIRRFACAAVLLVGVLALPIVAHAQVTSDPNRTEFTPSADHAVTLPDGRPAVSRYDLKLRRADSTTDFAVISLGKPSVGSNGVISVEFRSRLTSPPPSGVACVAVVTAVGPGGSSPSKPSNQFVFPPPLDPSAAGRHTRGDFDGNGAADLALFRYADGTWSVDGRTPAVFGRINDIPVPADYDGVPGDELAVFRPSRAEWHIQGRAAQSFGAVGDVPVPADYDGDGDADLAVFRPSSGYWYVRGGAEEQWGRAGDIPIPGDYDGDGRAEFAVFRPSTGGWYIRSQPAFSFGISGDIPVPADYDGDGTMDAAVYRPATGTWYVRGQFRHKLGARYDLPVPQDLNGDGRVELVVWRPATNTWYTLYHRSVKLSVTQGEQGDLPALLRPALGRFRPFDADGDRIADIAVFRRSTQAWYVRGSRSRFSSLTRWTLGLGTQDLIAPGDYDGDRRLDAAVCTASGCRIAFSSNPDAALDLPSLGSGAVPVPGDYDGDGRTDLAMFRRTDGLWRVLLSSSEFSAAVDVHYGRNLIPVAADYDGDGRTDLAVFRPSDAYWSLAYSSGGTVRRQRGRRGDKPIVGDFDGDGRADIGVFRPSTQQWFIWTSSSGWNTAMAAVKYGASTDIPVPADYNGDGLDDIAVYRPSNGYWYLRGIASRRLGSRTDIPLQKR